MRKTKVLILYAQYGQGHLQVARSLREQFKESGVSDVILTDLFAASHPFIDRMARFLYKQSFSSASFFYGWCYYLTRNMGHQTPFSRRFHAFGIRKLQEIITAEQPTMVINTFPMLVMPELKQRTGINIPIFSVLTDFDLHGRWLHSKIDKYYVATEDLKKIMTDRRVPPEKIAASGIPISQSFESPFDLTAVSHTYNLAFSRKTVLVMAGTYGAFKDLKNFCQALSENENIQVILVCGKDKKLEKELTHDFIEKPNIRILGFIENMYPLMAFSTCIVTKPGGITLSEALRSELPIFLFPPVPGQEKENARYLIDNHAARTAKSGKKLAKIILETLHDPKAFSEMKHAAKTIRKTNTAKTVVADIMSQIETGRAIARE